MNPTSKRIAVVAPVIGYLATAAGIVAVAAIAVARPDRSPEFWYKVAWIEFLALLVWSYWLGFLQIVLSAARRSGLGGTIPAVGVVVVCYAVLSCALMLLIPWSARIQWVIQIAMLVAVVILGVVVEIGRAGAVSQTQAITGSLAGPDQLAAKLRTNEEALLALPLDPAVRRLADAVKSLRESIQFSLPRAGTIADSPDYRALASDVQSLCSEMQASRPAAGAPQQVAPLIERALEQQRRVVELAAALKTSAG